MCACFMYVESTPHSVISRPVLRFGYHTNWKCWPHVRLPSLVSVAFYQSDVNKMMRGMEPVETSVYFNHENCRNVLHSVNNAGVCCCDSSSLSFSSLFLSQDPVGFYTYRPSTSVLRSCQQWQYLTFVILLCFVCFVHRRSPRFQRFCRCHEQR